MSPTQPTLSSTTSRPELDNLISEITVDCHDEDKQLIGFENAFDDANLPCPGTVVGENVEVPSVNPSAQRTINRRELIAACQHNGRRYEIAVSTSTLTQTPTPHA
jgi:hypothetical protein